GFLKSKQPVILFLTYVFYYLVQQLIHDRGFFLFKVFKQPPFPETFHGHYSQSVSFFHSGEYHGEFSIHFPYFLKQQRLALTGDGILSKDPGQGWIFWDIIFQFLIYLKQVKIRIEPGAE